MDWFEVYYEHYGEKGFNSREANRVLPYCVRCRDKSEKRAMDRLFQRDHIKCVGNGDGYLSLLVNLKFRKCCTFRAPCKHSCFEDRQYSVKEFLEEIYRPWKSGELVPNPEEEEPEPWAKDPLGWWLNRLKENGKID